MAQDHYTIQYTIAIPVNDLRDYIDETSFRGLTLEYASKLTSQIAAGVSIGFNGFYERKPYATYQDGTASLSGVQYRYSNLVPLYFTGTYFLRHEEERLNPYASLGVGAVYLERVTDMGLYRWDEDAWSFSLRPEAGMMYSFPAATVRFSIRYNEAFRNSEMKDQSFFSVNLGLVFMQW